MSKNEVPTSGQELWELAIFYKEKKNYMQALSNFLEGYEFVVAMKMAKEYNSEIKVMDGSTEDGIHFSANTWYAITKDGFQKFVGNAGGGSYRAVDIEEFWNEFVKRYTPGKEGPVVLLRKALDTFALSKINNS